jgi:hypothetical protein
MKTQAAPRKKLVPAAIPHGKDPAPFKSMHVVAIQALSAGVANEGQQKTALDWILKGACGIADWPYRDSERDTCIALGRQFVGQQIVGLLNVNVSALRQREGLEENEHG